MSKFFSITFAAAFLSASAFAAPAAFAQDKAADAAETSAAQSVIDQDVSLRGEHVQVQTIDGVVYLHGTVDSAAAADRAEALLRTIPTVGKVVDALGDNSNS